MRPSVPDLISIYYAYTKSVLYITRIAYKYSLYIIPSLLHAIIHSLLCASLALAVQYRVAPYTQCI